MRGNLRGARGPAKRAMDGRGPRPRSRAEPEVGACEKTLLFIERGEHRSRGMDAPRGEGSPRHGCRPHEAGVGAKRRSGRPGPEAPPAKEAARGASEHEASARPRPWMAGKDCRGTMPRTAPRVALHSEGRRERWSRALRATSGRPTRGPRPRTQRGLNNGERGPRDFRGPDHASKGWTSLLWLILPKDPGFSVFLCELLTS